MYKAETVSISTKRQAMQIPGCLRERVLCVECSGDRGKIGDPVVLTLPLKCRNGVHRNKSGREVIHIEATQAVKQCLSRCYVSRGRSTSKWGSEILRRRRSRVSRQAAGHANAWRRLRSRKDWTSTRKGGRSCGVLGRTSKQLQKYFNSPDDIHLLSPSSPD